jgi:hypothetical protein
VNAIDNPIKPKVNVEESIENAKVYCKQNPASFVSLRDYRVTFTTRPARTLQQSNTPLTPHTKSAQINPRSIGLVLLAARTRAGHS